MSVELAALVVCGLLSLLLALITVAVHFRRFGGKMIRSNRDDYPPLTGLAARTVRAHKSLNEALLPFATVVVTATSRKASTPVTAIAALVFLAARLAHAGFYLAGATPWRSVSFYVGLVRDRGDYQPIAVVKHRMMSVTRRDTCSGRLKRDTQPPGRGNETICETRSVRPSRP